jgi:hypothetical protein
MKRDRGDFQCRSKKFRHSKNSVYENMKNHHLLERMKNLHLLCLIVVMAGWSAVCFGQVNSGSDGSDGAFNPTVNTVINMADHPTGIYQYTSVNIPGNVTLSFIPNAANTPVVWLVQSNCVINGFINLSGSVIYQSAGPGGPGGFRGGNGAGGGAAASDGTGPGGGKSISAQYPSWAGNASFATAGDISTNNHQALSGEIYGNDYLLPLVGGSGGGGGGGNGYGGAGGGGAILIAASGTIELNSPGQIYAVGGNGGNWGGGDGAGSGGSVRLVATTLAGNGQIITQGGNDFGLGNSAGNGRIRLDALANGFVGSVSGNITRGFQPIIIPPPNQAVSLAIQSVAGIAVAANPTGASTTPDVVVSSGQQNPVSIVVRCVNIPLNTDIIVDVKPANGPTVRAVGANNTGTQASSTATVSVTMPRGAGTIQAKAVSGIAGSLGASLNNGEKFKHYAQTGLTADGELFAKMEITATLGKGQEIAYITESGKRFVLPRN